MIDFHSHVLPKIDDGSASVEESMEMLRLSFQKGIKKMVATPHFYASKETPERFLARRNAAWNLLADSLSDDIPEIYLGAEVYYYIGISHTNDLQRLCIGDTNVLMIEMPFHKWSDRMIHEVISLAQDTDFTILLAHIDRYLQSQEADTWDLLAENGVLFQANASFFLGGWISRRKAFKLLREDSIAVLGSDCHNMSDRPQNLDTACEIIQNKLGEGAVDSMMNRANRLLMSEGI